MDERKPSILSSVFTQICLIMCIGRPATRIGIQRITNNLDEEELAAKIPIVSDTGSEVKPFEKYHLDFTGEI